MRNMLPPGVPGHHPPQEESAGLAPPTHRLLAHPWGPVLGRIRAGGRFILTWVSPPYKQELSDARFWSQIRAARVSQRPGLHLIPTSLHCPPVAMATLGRSCQRWTPALCPNRHCLAPQ